MSLIESCLSLWELLSTLKKLAHLSIELCLLYDRDNAKRKKLITMFKRCRNLQALEIQCNQGWKGCIEYDINGDFLFSHFPSLQHCRMDDFQYPAIPYVVTNCRQLKYLFDYSINEISLPSFSNSCHLQVLSIQIMFLNLTDESVQELSAHGELEQISLFVHSITNRGVTTLIKNSPNLISLSVSCRTPISTTDRVREMFNSHITNYLLLDKRVLPS